MKKIFHRIFPEIWFFGGIISLFLSGCHQNNAPGFSQNIGEKSVSNPEIVQKKPKNIIFLIGDGMALAQVSALNIHQTNRSVFDLFKVVGFHKSHSSNDLVTDSAAGATAFSCGCKTFNNAVGVNADTIRCETLLEKLKKRGFAVGMATSCSASHATPASFISHQKSRAFYYEIAEDYTKADFDCLIAGGENYFQNRDDKEDLFKIFKKKGYKITRGPTLKRSDWVDISAPHIHFIDEFEPPAANNGRQYLPQTPNLTANFLKNRSKKGFFLMIEGSQIDWACHANDARWLFSELTDFDKTIQNALNFARADGETLVVVTGDHDGGGLVIAEKSRWRNVQAKWSSKDHGGVLVPVFADGPGAENFYGIYENTAIFNKILTVLGEN